AVSAMTLGASFQNRVAAALTYGQTSTPTPTEINSALPTVLPSGANPYLSGAVSQDGLYAWSPRTRFVEALRFTGVDSLNAKTLAPGAAGLPPVSVSYVIGGTLRLERDVIDNLFFLEGDLADSLVPNRSQQGMGLADSVLLAQLAVGWRRDFALA